MYNGFILYQKILEYLKDEIEDKDTISVSAIVLGQWIYLLSKDSWGKEIERERKRRGEN